VEDDGEPFEGEDAAGLVAGAGGLSMRSREKLGGQGHSEANLRGAAVMAGKWKILTLRSDFGRNSYGQLDTTDCDRKLQVRQDVHFVTPIQGQWTAREDIQPRTARPPI